MSNEKVPIHEISLLPEINTCIHNSMIDKFNITQEHLPREYFSDCDYSCHINTSASPQNIDRIDYCDFIDEITAAIQAGSVHLGSSFVPIQFATVDAFEKFLSEIDEHYKRSVERYGQRIRKVLIATDEIYRAHTLKNNLNGYQACSIAPLLKPCPDIPDAITNQATDLVVFNLKTSTKKYEVEPIKQTEELAEEDQIAVMTPREQLNQIQEFFAD